MDRDLTHASFFSGAGGLDMGLERAGWRTVSFSEIDPYASAVLAERWPGVPNLGDITGLELRAQGVRGSAASGEQRGDAYRDATLWTGGFPCQDLSVAGKRAGFAGARSSLAFAFLGFVERYRPPALILENVPGLLSSNAGRDLGTLLGTLGRLGYGWAYRVLDAQFFGVPQRRRRVFIVALDTRRGFGAECAAEVLSVGSRCYRHPPTGIEAGEGVADGARSGVDVARAITATSGKRHDDDIDTLVPTLTVGGRASGAGSSYDNTPWTLVGPPPDASGMRAPDGLAGRSHDRGELAATLNSGGNDGGFRTEPGEHLVIANGLRASDGHGSPRGDGGDNLVTVGNERSGDDRWLGPPPREGIDGRDANTEQLLGAADGLLPLGLDSHRYRCCGNGVVSSVAEWIGLRLAEVMP